MLDVNREQKKRILIMQNTRRNIVKDLVKYINLDIDSFVDVEESREIKKQVYRKIDTITNVKELNKDLQDNLCEIIDLKDKFNEYLDNEVALFHYKDSEIGLILLKLYEVFENLGYLSKFCRFKDGYRDFVIIDLELKYGICIERYEYFNKLIVWKE